MNKKLVCIGLAAALAGCFGHVQQAAVASQPAVCTTEFNSSNIRYVGEDQRAIEVNAAGVRFELTFDRPCRGLLDHDFQVHGLMIDQIDIPYARDSERSGHAQPPPQEEATPTDLCDPSQYQSTGNNMDHHPGIDVQGADPSLTCPIRSARRL